VNAEVIGDASRITRRKCISRVHQCLAAEGIAVFPTADIDISTKPRGGIHFIQFNPEETLFQLQPGFPKYFHASRQSGLIPTRDAHSLGRRLIALAARVRARYSGALEKHLSTGVVGEFLDNAFDSATLGLLEATEDGFPDLLHEQLPLPCVVEDYLMAREFSNLRLDFDAIAKAAVSPIRAVIAGLGLVRVGHWLGLTTDEINHSLELLDTSFDLKGPFETHPESKIHGEKVVIPIFSLGFQGSIVGFFCNLEPHHKMRIRAILEEAGRCLGEQNALERKSQLQNLLRTSRPNAKVFAQVALQIASPVEHLVVSRDNELYAYVIRKEADYLAGYDQRFGDPAEKLKRDPENEMLFLHALDPPIQVHFKTLRGQIALDPVIHALRLSTALSGFFLSNMATAVMRSEVLGSHFPPLELSELDRVIGALEHQLGVSRGKQAAAKHLCFFEIVKEEHVYRETRLTNAQMLKRISAKLNLPKVNGYQVTGEASKKFALEIDQILPNRFLFEPLNEKVIRVRWG
jgi:hypothetical protein